MSLTSFPGPEDLKLEFKDMVLDGKNISTSPWGVSNPHPGFGKDPNILNEYGHTKYPMFVGNVIVNNEEEEKAARGEEAPTEKLPEVQQGWGEKPALREDGPTIQEYVDAGYDAKNYPPNGYASKSTQEEIDSAIADATKGWD